MLSLRRGGSDADSKEWLGNCGGSNAAMWCFLNHPFTSIKTAAVSYMPCAALPRAVVPGRFVLHKFGKDRLTRVLNLTLLELMYPRVRP